MGFPDMEVWGAALLLRRSNRAPLADMPSNGKRKTVAGWHTPPQIVVNGYLPIVPHPAESYDSTH